MGSAVDQLADEASALHAEFSFGGINSCRFSVEPVQFLRNFRLVKISIIVPAFNEEKLIVASLKEIKKACAAFSDEDWQTEVIVCDNNSSDRTGELSRAEGALVVFESVNQIARARNAGARAASGDWLVFVDADSHPAAN